MHFYSTNTYPNDARVEVDELFFANWSPVEGVVGAAHHFPGNSFSESANMNRDEKNHKEQYLTSDIPEVAVDSQASDSQHALMPRQGIRLVRDRLLAAISPSQLQAMPTASPYIVLLSRTKEAMRRLKEEDILFARLVDEAANGEQTRVVRFDGGSSSVVEAAALFHGAAVVIGVHGGALSNIVFCKPATDGEGDDSAKTRLVIELGFAAAQTRHYGHAAAALDLPYALELLELDPRGPGAPEVSISDSAIDRIVAMTAAEVRKAERV